jgi:hypothetical protein
MKDAPIPLWLLSHRVIHTSGDSTCGQHALAVRQVCKGKFAPCGTDAFWNVPDE